ncbi:uncharacterized protein LOC127792517 isoform X3 [Diospyros lotus]|uniref:uncharacterized protein LOC127792517 isoform X3 n=1 Tax=Diospyros lotus TaxID=55363 RepID=UPI002258069D|nr:uncharacterized protein LOC127792517 isoform X3 [Diospyros lotus]
MNQFAMFSAAPSRALRSKWSAIPIPPFCTKTHMDSSSSPGTRTPHAYAFSTSSSSPSPPRGAAAVVVSLQEWQAWGTTSPVPAMVAEIVEELKDLERDIDAQMSFGGIGGKLQGDFKVHEDKKHRAKYQTLGDSEKKLQFFAARQIACRLLGSRGYLCQKDFLRQNNTGKLLWQVFGVQAATLCLFGIPEHEEIMWNALKTAGKNNVWCLYPNKNAPTKLVQNIFSQDRSTGSECEKNLTNGERILNYVLLDGTWNNSAAMFRRLQQDQAKEVWGDDLSCISLSTGASAMHKLRPQPSWDRTCTAAAAAGLLNELQLLPDFISFGFDKQADAVEEALAVLLDALTGRRRRMGRSITRRGRHNSDIC